VGVMLSAMLAKDFHGTDDGFIMPSQPLFGQYSPRTPRSPVFIK